MIMIYKLLLWQTVKAQSSPVYTVACKCYNVNSCINVLFFLTLMMHLHWMMISYMHIFIDMLVVVMNTMLVRVS